jgi:hypothetical protein
MHVDRIRTQVGLRQKESGFEILNRGSASMFPPIKEVKETVDIEIDPRLGQLTAEVEALRAKVDTNSEFKCYSRNI